MGGIHNIPVELLTECIVLSGNIAIARTCKQWHEVADDVVNLTRLLIVRHGSADAVVHRCCDCLESSQQESSQILVLRRLFAVDPELPTGPPLVRAVTRDNFAVVRELLSHTLHRVDPNYGQGAALNVATVRGSTEMVALLLEAGAHADARGGAFLVSACKNGHLDVAKLLLAAPHHAVRGDARDGEALAVAAAYGHDDVVEHLFALSEAGGRPRADCQEGRALILAVANDRAKIVKMLLANGATADTRNCLSLAVRRRRSDIVDLLLSQPENPAYADMENHELLWLAVMNNDVAVAEKLLKKRAHAARADCRDGSLFMMAVGNGSLQMVELFLSQPEHAARADMNGSLALSIAARNGDVAKARLLLEQKEHPARADERTLEIALNTGDAELVDLLRR